MENDPSIGNGFEARRSELDGRELSLDSFGRVEAGYEGDLAVYDLDDPSDVYRLFSLAPGFRYNQSRFVHGKAQVGDYTFIEPGKPGEEGRPSVASCPPDESTRTVLDSIAGNLHRHWDGINHGTLKGKSGFYVFRLDGQYYLGYHRGYSSRTDRGGRPVPEMHFVELQLREDDLDETPEAEVRSISECRAMNFPDGYVRFQHGSVEELKSLVGESPAFHYIYSFASEAFEPTDNKTAQNIPDEGLFASIARTLADAKNQASLFSLDGHVWLAIATTRKEEGFVGAQFRYVGKRKD